MAKSVNEYYSEKMQKLLEMQKNNPEMALPPSTGKGTQKPQGGRGYYDNFRSRVDADKKTPRPESQRAQPPRKAPHERTVIDDIREGKRPRPHTKAETQNTTGDKSRADIAHNQRKRPRVSPEQTAEDKFAESVKQIEAMQTAKRARSLRKIRDMAVSVGLIAAVFVVMCIVVYRLIFVISDVKVKGSKAYSSEELVIASGIHKGDHLFSFSSKELSNLMTLRCPEISEVDVERTPPGTIIMNITEEKSTFYADFYGEYRMLSSSLRVLGSVTESDAKKKGCIKLKLPDVTCATAGLAPEFSSVRDDDYIYEICKALLDSPLAERAGSLDISDKYNIVLTVDSKYIIRFGDNESFDTKLKIANAVLKDEMFKKDIKATIDVTKLSETSVVVDEGLKID